MMRRTSLLGPRRDKEASAREEANIRGSIYRQGSSWHHDANAMLGTSTSNFAGDSSDLPESDQDEGAPLPCIVELLGCDGVPAAGSTASPNADHNTANRSVNPFCTMKVVPFATLDDADSTTRSSSIGEERRWPFKSKTASPRWHKVRDLGTYQRGDLLRITVHLHRSPSSNASTPAASSSPGAATAAAAETARSEPVARTDLMLADIEVGVVYTVMVPVLPAEVAKRGSNSGSLASRSSGESYSSLKSHKEIPPLVLTLRLIPPRAARKTLFIIRHGESKWNEAQSKHNIVGLADVDHGLTHVGRQQAEQLYRQLELELQAAGAAEAAHADVLPNRCTPLPADHATKDAAYRKFMASRSPDEATAAAQHVRQLWSSDTAVWSSPLTRTLQTALIGLQGHPSLVLGSTDNDDQKEEENKEGKNEKKPGSGGGGGLVLIADAREVKGMGSLDSIGRARGNQAITQLLNSELCYLYNKSADTATAASSASSSSSLTLSHPPAAVAAEGVTYARRASSILPTGASYSATSSKSSAIVNALLAPRLDALDAEDEWWTSAFSSDSKNDVNMRLNELLNAVKFAEASTVVLVSHSNLLRALMGRRLHPSLRDEKPALTQIAGAQKLKNCAIVRLELDFTQDLSNGVMALEPMFVDQPEAAFLPPGK